MWAGIGYGTVDKCTQRVLGAILAKRFREGVMRWPDAARIEEAKLWMEIHSCPA